MGRRCVQTSVRQRREHGIGVEVILLISAVTVVTCALGGALAVPVGIWVASPLLAEGLAMSLNRSLITWFAAMPLALPLAFYGASAVLDYVLYKEAKNMILASTSTAIAYLLGMSLLRLLVSVMSRTFSQGQTGYTTMTLLLIIAIVWGISIGTAIWVHDKIFAWSEQQKLVSAQTLPVPEPERFQAAT